MDYMATRRHGQGGGRPKPILMTGVTGCDGFKTANLSPIFLYYISRREVSDRCDRLKLIIDKMIKDTLKLLDGGCQSGEIVKTTRHTRHTCHELTAINYKDPPYKQYS